MTNVKSHQEATAAEDKSIGFDYQYYYFLYLILGLGTGESIGLEVKDDIHIDFPDNKQTLLQLKHSVQTNAQGEIINLRESDTDLWKTIYNWVKVINDKIEGRETLDSRIEFIKRTDFILITNKAFNTKNQFLVNLEKLKEGKMDTKEFKDYFKKKYDLKLTKKVAKESSEKKGEDKLLLYIKEFLDQEDQWLEEFLKKLSFSLNEDDLIERIKLRIKAKFIPENKIEDVFNSLDSNIRRDNYIAIKKGERIEYSFDNLHERYTRCFLLGRTDRRIIRRDKPSIEEIPEEQLFIKQLEDIGIISKEDDDYQDQVIQRTIAKLITFNNLEKWKQEGELTSTEQESFDRESIYEWKVVFDRTYRKVKRKFRDDSIVDEIELIDLANECLDDVLSKKLNIQETQLDLEMSNGQYYLLSDKPLVGWRYDWGKRYKNE
ncbi:ABC-three component system protein [Gracilibacillus massiliensis]|uniref:ABC-three component system protein n=1 Tax=Gracilibacillus massiliensis TaxID=1564956 RepID=UPI00071C384B|nr:ABC-three component system protein [Gracilibacillus massiliensis]